MTRGRYYHDPARKNLEQYQDFSGGLNNMSSNDNTKDTELVQLVNTDLGDRGSLKRRKGYQSQENPDAEGKPQMFHRYHRRYAPYNLLGFSGAFDGLKKKTGQNMSIGDWYAFGLEDESNAYKIERGEAGNLIHNGDFEKGEEGWYMDIGRHDIGKSFVGESIYSLSGNNVLRLEIYKDHSGFLNEYQKGNNRFSVNSGDTVHAKVNYHRSAYSLGGKPYRIHLVANIRYSDGRPSERIYIRAYDTGDDWKTIEGDFIIPDGAESCLLGVGMYDTDTENDTAVYFENFEAYHLSNDLAINGGFEDYYPPEYGWDLDESGKDNGWVSLMGESIYATGDFVLRISRLEDSDKTIANEYQKEPISVAPGDKIHSQVNYHRTAYSLGVVPTRVHLVASFIHDNGDLTREYARVYDVGSEWKKLEGIFTIPEGVHGVTLGLGIYDAYTEGDVGAYFDQFKVYKHKKVSIDGIFEQGETHWNLNYDDISAGDSIVGNSQTAFIGANVMRIQRYKGHGGFYNEYQTNEKGIDVTEGDEIYGESYYRRGARVLGVSPYRIHLIASFKFKDGTLERHYIRRYDADTDWKKVSGYFKVPKNAIFVRFGVGIYDSKTDDDVSAYFDGVYARKVIQGSENSALAIHSSTGDTGRRRGMGAKFTGMEANKYYIYLVEFKAESFGKGAIAVRDERFGIYPHDSGKVFFHEFETNEKEWTTKYQTLQTYTHLDAARAYVYNYAPLGDVGTVYYDNARIFEITSEMYEKIDKEPEYTGEKLVQKFPYRVGQLRNELITENIIAAGGSFFINGKEKSVEGGKPIQSERIIEATEFGQNLYIASGSDLLVYNGSTIYPIVPYVPDPLEELYIGTNALQTNRFEISDKEQSTVKLKQIRFSRRYGVTNKPISLSVSVNKPSATIIEYKFERRNVRDKEDYWETLQNWSMDNKATFNTDIAGEYQFKISVRDKDASKDGDGNIPVLDTYKIPKYIIRPTDIDEEDVPIDGNTIHFCNRILVHWNRIVLYGDNTKPDVMYLSDLNNPRFFPTNNTLQFTNPRKERITSMTPYRDNLVVFTPSSIQALYGTNPEDFKRVVLNTDFGCIADRGAKVVKNSLIFPSYEGIALLKSVGTSESRFNVELIDGKIKELVEQSHNSVSYVRNNQYCLVYPDSGKQLRYYYEWGVWVCDKSDSLDMMDIMIEDNDLYALGSDGRLLFDSKEYADEGTAFRMIIGTKLFDFGEPYSIKKTKELQVMFDPIEHETSLQVDVFIDEPYKGKVFEYTEDFEHVTNYDEINHNWNTSIIPTQSNTLHKGFSSDEFKGKEELISTFAERTDAYMVFSGSNELKGLQIKNGVVYQHNSPGQESIETLAIYNDGSLGIIVDGTNSLDDVRHTFHSDIPHLITGGVKNVSLDMEDIRPRQAIGQRADGSYVIITAGGRPGEISEGITLDALAEMFMQENCTIAYCLGEAQAYEDGTIRNVYFDGKEREESDYLYLTSDIVRVIEGKRNGVIRATSIGLSRDDDVYKVTAPGKGMTVGTYIEHKDNNPVKLVGLGYIFKLKKP